MNRFDDLTNGEHGIYSMPTWMARAIFGRNERMTICLAHSAPYKLSEIDKILGLMPLVSKVNVNDN